MRKLLFWTHLSVGVIAGLVILVMAATGVVLTYEKQMLAWSDRTAATARPSPGAPRLVIEQLLRAVRAEDSSSVLTNLTVSSAADAPALVTVGSRVLAVNAYTGAVIGEASPRLRRFFRTVTAWHRWFAVEGRARPIARFFTGWGNFLFLLIVMAGPFLWMPRRWTKSQVRAVVLFKSGLQARARDFNWHNVIGIWCCVPLMVIVVSALPMSFPWANSALYRIVGEAPPAPARPANATGGAEGAGAQARAGRDTSRPSGTASRQPTTHLNDLWGRAESHISDWKTISLRIPSSPSAPVLFTIDRGTGGQPQLRGTLTFDPVTAELMRWETFETQTLGRRLRSIARFAHTGEFFGITGQTIAGIASAGAVVLVWTGLALAVRRLAAWRKRRFPDIPAVARTSAA